MAHEHWCGVLWVKLPAGGEQATSNGAFTVIKFVIAAHKVKVLSEVIGPAVCRMSRTSRGHWAASASFSDLLKNPWPA